MQDNDNLDEKIIPRDSEVNPNTLESPQFLIQASHIQSSYISPLPPPQIIEGYEKIVPGSADRILIMVEKQSEHRRELEKLVIKEDIRRSNIGLSLAGIITIIIIGCATYLAVNNREVTASVMIGTTIVALSANFIYGSVARKNERAEKQQELLDAKSPKE